MEQRNGRIDRKLQPAAEVRCHYFVLPQRAEDRVLEVLVRKTETIKRELGSLSQVIDDDIERRLAARHPPPRRRAPRWRDRGRPTSTPQRKRSSRRSSKPPASARTSCASRSSAAAPARALARLDRLRRRPTSAPPSPARSSCSGAEPLDETGRRDGAVWRFPPLDRPRRGRPELGSDARHAARAAAKRTRSSATGAARRRSARSSSRTPA